GVCHVVEPLRPGHGRDAHSGMLPGTHAKKSRSDQLLRIRWLDLVAGNLVQDELIVRQVPIKAANHVVPVAPRVGTLIIVRVAAGVGVSHYVEPMTRPALAVARRGEQPVYQGREGFAI